MKDHNDFTYLPYLERDIDWGLVISCAGKHSIAPGENYPPPSHPAGYSFLPSIGRILDEFQLVYVASGRGHLRSASSGDVELKAGDVFILFPNERHSYSPDKETGWQEYWIGFHGPNIEQRMQRGFFSPSSPVFHTSAGDTKEIINIFERAIGVAKHMGKGYQQMLCGYVNMLLGYIFSIGDMEDKDQTEIREGMHKAMIYIQTHYMHDIHPEDISDAIGWSYSRFRKEFLKRTGLTPYQCVQEVRIKRSKDFLLNTQKPLKEVAYMVGFSNPDYFSTAFRRIVGVTPSEFRNR